MIICVCANVGEQHLDRVIEDGARSVNAVARRCGAGNGCGDCRFLIRDRLRKHRDAREAAADSSVSTEPTPAMASVA